MTQRNPMNDRYNTEEKRTGKTRKSSASAKPKATRAATLRDPAPKTKKQKKEEARERERKEQQKAGVIEGRFEETETYKKLRRYWWVALSGAIACTALSFVFQAQANEGLRAASMPIMIAAYVLIIIAFWIDLGKIRKERKIYAASIATNKSKEARREQKRLRAEQREQEREAAEKFEQAKAEEAEKASNRGGFLARFRKPKDDAADSAEAGNEGEAADKAKDSSK